MTPAHTHGPVLWNVDERGVANLVFNRPEVRNAYNGAFIAGLLGAMVGIGGFKSISGSDRGGEFGLALLPSAWGTGGAAEFHQHRSRSAGRKLHEVDVCGGAIKPIQLRDNKSANAIEAHNCVQGRIEVFQK